MATVSFHALWNSLPAECFPLIYDLSGFKSGVNRHIFSLALLYDFHLFLPFFVTPCLVLASNWHPSSEIQLKKCLVIKQSKL